MYYLKKSIIFLASIVSVIGMRVSMEGKLSLGKEVMETLSHFLGVSPLNGRRFLLSVPHEDNVTSIVRSAFLCYELEFCQDLKKIVDEYVIVLAKVTESILSESLGKDFKSNIFGTQLKYCLQGVKEITITASSNLAGADKIFAWIDTFKKVNFKFQELGLIFFEEGEVNDTKDELGLKQKLVIATSVTEAKFTNNLCILHEICSKTYEVTTSLNILLGELNTMSEEKNREFVKVFFKILYDTSFYSHISEVLSNRIQDNFNEMFFTNQVSLKNILMSVKNMVGNRLDVLKTRKLKMLSHDEHLLQIMLSDMDHIYSGHSFNPFSHFMESFYAWAKENITINVQMRQTVSDIATELTFASEEILYKLKNEVETFIELTIGFK